VSSVRDAKRRLEQCIGQRLEFRLHAMRYTDEPVEVHLAGADEPPTFLGAGPTHHEALSDARRGVLGIARSVRHEAAL